MNLKKKHEFVCLFIFVRKLKSTISPIITSFGPRRLIAAKIAIERMNHMVKSIEKIKRAAQKHWLDGRNRRIKPTKKRIIARTSS